MKYRTFQRGLLILVSIFMLRGLVSCICNCPEPMMVDMDFNLSTIQSIENTGLYISNYPTKRDTLPAKAVAFFIELTDTINAETYPEWAKSMVNTPIVSGFNSAMAFQPCLCNRFDFVPKRKLKSISISTLFDLTRNIKAGEDITHLFVGRSDNEQYAYNLYCTMDEIMEYHSNVEVYDNPIISFSIYLQEAVQNDSLQLEVNFNFDDNTCITNSTPTIYINHPQP